MNKIKKKFKKKYLKNKIDKVKTSIIFKIMLFLIIFLWLIFLLLIFLLYLKIISPLPDVKDLKNIQIPESSIIYDRNWEELYKIYSEKRTYVKYNDISKNMVNAIVAWEDKRFWTTPWFDFIGITRAAINWILNWNHFSWTSGITQQLAKITYLSNEKTLERKLKELYLSVKIDSNFDKKYILELYLNKVFFWWNSYWVEQASKTYFWINSSELSVLQASILASLPKAPTWLSPYNKKELLLWYPLITNSEDIKDSYKILSVKQLEWNKNIVDKLTNFLNKLKFKKLWSKLEICSINNNYLKYNFKVNNWCIILKYNELLDFLNSIYIKSERYDIEYRTWRKDYILWRMLEDWYINFDEYKKSIIESFWFEFLEYKDEIKYPYFIMYIKDYLVKEFWEDLLKKWWLRIFTTIDSKLQDEAVSLIKKQVEINKVKYNARNAALISINNKTWEILSYVWWVNYFDEKNLWYNDMLNVRLQPWSSFKPFVYILSMIKNWFNSKTIFTDNKITFPGWYTPHNSDWKFMWKMTLSKALDYSRNIPAVKNYYAAWWEEEIIKFLENFWVTSLRKFKQEYKEKYWKNYVYNAPMALWTAQLTAIELALAYQVIANYWIRNKINPILKIEDKYWKVIYDLNNKKLLNKQVIDRNKAVEMSLILSNSKDRPKDWNYFLTVPWLQLAAKTGTSTIQYKENKWDKKEQIFPKNMWTIWFTPQITTVVWAWNTSWEKLKKNGYWINWAWPIMRDYMKFAHKDLEVEKWIK